MELQYAGAVSTLLSYNRTGSAYLGLDISGLTINIKPSGSTVGAFSSTGLTVTGTLGVTGAITNTAGTANGVTYLNGSKVLTSGTALAFDGTTFKVQNNNTVTPVFQIQSYAAVGTAIANITYDQSTDIYKLSNPSTFTGSGIDFGTGASSATRYHIDTGGTSIWSVGGSESMRLTSALLYTASTVNIAIGASSGTSGTRLTLQESATNSAALSLINRNSTQNWKITVDGVSVDDKLLAFIDNGTSQIRMALTDTGNLGLGVTPSSWTGVGVAFETLGGAIIGQGTNNISYFQNTYYASAAFRYKTTNPASYFEQSSGKHVWYNAPSGTAGNAITFTQAMTLDASNNLFLGGTTSSYTASNRTVLAINGATSSFLSLQSGGTDRFYVITTSSQTDLGTLTAIPLVFNTNATERARFNTTGALVFAGGTTTADGIGITFPATQSASTNANTLDDYEEGTWTPSQGAGLTVVGTFSSSGTYTKIGRVVTIRGTVTGSTSVSIVAAGVISNNLPFSCSGEATGTCVASTVTASSANVAGGSIIYSAGAISATGSIWFSNTYVV
jgi:hypothetical protein